MHIQWRAQHTPTVMIAIFNNGSGYNLWSEPSLPAFITIHISSLGFICFTFYYISSLCSKIIMYFQLFGYNAQTRTDTRCRDSNLDQTSGNPGEYGHYHGFMHCNCKITAKILYKEMNPNQFSILATSNSAQVTYKST